MHTAAKNRLQKDSDVRFESADPIFHYGSSKENAMLLKNFKNLDFQGLGPSTQLDTPGEAKVLVDDISTLGKH